MAPELIPAILCEDEKTAHLRLRAVERLVDWAQLDVLDDTLYPYHSWAKPDRVKTWRPACSLELHLMVADPGPVVQTWEQVPQFRRAIWHLEAAIEHLFMIKLVRHMKREAGLALAPGTPYQKLEPYLPFIDRVLVLGVAPGRSGQALIPQTLETVRWLAQQPSHPVIAFDGGTHEETLAEIVAAGTQAICAGSLIFNHPPVEERINKIRGKLEELTTTN